MKQCHICKNYKMVSKLIHPVISVFRDRFWLNNSAWMSSQDCPRLWSNTMVKSQCIHSSCQWSCIYTSKINTKVVCTYQHQDKSLKRKQYGTIGAAKNNSGKQHYASAELHFRKPLPAKASQSQS